MIFRNVFTFILILLELAWFVVYFQLKIVLLHCNKIPTQGDGIQWIKGVGFSFKLLACLWKCVCLHVKWLNKYIKLIKGGDPWWFQTPTSQPILSPSLVARPSSSSDLWQVLHRYLLHPQEELDQPLTLLAIFTIQITFSFCTAFLLEKRCAGVDGWSNCSRLLHFRPLPQH